MNEEKNVGQAVTEPAPNYKPTMDDELNRYWGISYPQFVERLVKTAGAREGEKVLDMATGAAMMPGKLFADYLPQEWIVSVDVSQAMLSEGRRALSENLDSKNIDRVCASAMEMPFDDGAFNVIICGLGAHHMNVPKMLAEAKRLLAKDGRLVIGDMGATPFWRRTVGKIVLGLLMVERGFIRRSSRSRAEAEAYKNVRTAREWLDILLDFGFTKIHIEDFRPRRPWFPSRLTLQAVMAE